MAERVQITVVVDNYIDIFVPSTDVAQYPVPGRTSQLWAEQGLSFWVEVSEKGESTRLLYDFGRSSQVLLRNAELLELDFRQLDFLVLSHGHVDHYGSLCEVLRRTDEGCKLIVHPKAYGKKRYVRLNDGSYAGPWDIAREVFDEFGSRIYSVTDPSDLGLGIHVSGEIEKKTDFEPGMPNAFVEIDGDLVHDEIADDQGIIIELENQGLVVLTGCCHAGLVNTLEHAQKLFPKQNVYALVGGFHLNNADENQMGKTLRYLSELGIEYVAGLHCTGYYAQRILMDHFKDRWIPSTVGAQITFGRG